jgi:hypothetical protein
MVCLIDLTDYPNAPRFKNLKRQRLYIFRSRQSVGPFGVEN